MKLVSIIMTCHNGERYLVDSINSIINQTYENWEIIFIDNFSSDKSKKIVNSFKDKRIKYHKTDKLLNLGNVRTMALSLSKGEFISFLDVDDLWLEKKLELQIKKFLFNEKIDVVYTNYYKMTENNYSKINKKLYSGYCKKEVIQSYLKGKPLTAWLTLMIKKSSLKKLDYYFDGKLHITSDFDLIIRLSEFSYFEYLDDYLCKYRIHEDNESKNKKSEISELAYIINKFNKNNELSKILSTNYFAQKIKLKNFLYNINLLN